MTDMASPEHLRSLERIREETSTDGRGVLEAMCREAGPANWSRPLEALEMYAEARTFLEEEIEELVGRMRTHYDPPISWDDIAERLGVSRQTTWTRFRSVQDGTVTLRQRPGPRTEADRVVFRFRVNKSYGDRGELTIPTNFNDALLERLPGDGPSWSAMLRTKGDRSPVKLRRGETGGHPYYQLRIPRGARESLRLRRNELVDVRIDLLGALVVEIEGR